METTVRKRSVAISGHKTSVSLEDAFWGSLKEIADQRHIALTGLVQQIDENRASGNLSSAIRMFVLEHYKTAPLSPAWKA